MKLIWGPSTGDLSKYRIASGQLEHFDVTMCNAFQADMEPIWQCTNKEEVNATLSQPGLVVTKEGFRQAPWRRVANHSVGRRAGDKDGVE